jgi:predicted O-methyltransferase YrrM
MFRLNAYICYIAKAKGRHRVHSPFVYGLVTEVLCDRKRYYAFEPIEAQRARWRASDATIEVNDLGAGSKSLKKRQRRVKDIAQTSLKRPKHARMLFRLIQYCHFKRVLELGTSLGVTTAYLAAAAEEVISLEGCRETIRLAQDTLNNLKLNDRVQLLCGDFDDLLLHPAVQAAPFDLIFIDGNHRGEALLRYVKKLQPLLSEGGCFVVDDIYWSNDMQQAWIKLKNDLSYQLSIDVFELGLLFTGLDRVKQHFTLRY